MEKSVIIRIATFLLIALATLFSIMSIAGDYWYGSNNVHVGLWKERFGSICRKLFNVKGGSKITYAIFSLITNPKPIITKR